MRKKLSFFKLLNNSGFSLVEIMVAAGMLGVISLGVTQMMSNMTKGQKNFEQDVEVNEINNKLKKALADQSTCNYSLVERHRSVVGSLISSASIQGANWGTNSIRLPGIYEVGASKFSSFAATPPAPRANMGALGNLTVANDEPVVTACNNVYKPGTISDSDLRTYGCLYGDGKGRILIHDIRITKKTAEANSAMLEITYALGVLINTYIGGTEDLTTYYAGLSNEEQLKLSGGYGHALMTKRIPIRVNYAEAAEITAITNSNSLVDLYPAPAVAAGDIISCYTEQVDIIEGSCANIGGQVDDGDNTCRRVRLKSIAQADGTFGTLSTDNDTALAVMGDTNLWGSLSLGATGANISTGDEGDIDTVGGLALGTARDADPGNIIMSGGLSVGTDVDQAAGNARINVSLGVGVDAPGAAGQAKFNNSVAIGSSVLPSGTDGDLRVLNDAVIDNNTHTKNNLGVGALPPIGGPGNAKFNQSIAVGSAVNPSNVNGDILAGNNLTANNSLGVGAVAPGTVGQAKFNNSVSIGSTSNPTGTNGDLTVGNNAHVSTSLGVGVSAPGGAGDGTFQGIVRINGLGTGTRTSADDNMATTIGWVRNHVAETLAPAGSEVNNVALDILRAATTANEGLGAEYIRRESCTRTYVVTGVTANIQGTWNSGTKNCTFDLSAAFAQGNCSVNGRCAQVYGTNFVQSAKFCIGGTGSSNCITRVASSCPAGQFVTGWRFGQVICSSGSGSASGVYSTGEYTHTSTDGQTLDFNMGVHAFCALNSYHAHGYLSQCRVYRSGSSWILRTGHSGPVLNDTSTVTCRAHCIN